MESIAKRLLQRVHTLVKEHNTLVRYRRTVLVRGGFAISCMISNQSLVDSGVFFLSCYVLSDAMQCATYDQHGMKSLSTGISFAYRAYPTLKTVKYFLEQTPYQAEKAEIAIVRELTVNYGYYNVFYPDVPPAEE